MTPTSMDNSGVEDSRGEAPGYRSSSSFAAVLQEIYQQTQNEIQASRSRSSVPPFGLTPLMGVPDETFRFEPLVDPAISYISDILAEVEDEAPGHPLLSVNEFLAYKMKATEVAALLKEDSPSLSLKIESENPLSPDGGATSISEDSYLQGFHDTGGEDSYLQGSQDTGGADIFSCVDADFPDFAKVVSESSLNGPHLRAPLGLPALEQPRFVRSLTQEVSSPESSGNGKLNSKDKAESPEESGPRPNMHKTQKSPKVGKGLKPRRDGASARKKSAGKARSTRDGEQEFVDINDLLLQSAQAVGVNNLKRAVEILNKVRQHASPYGNGAERLAYYFAEALDARFSGTGWPLYLGLLHRRPSQAEILKATCMYMASCPFVKASHYFINQTILDAAKGASRLHILELQVTGYQYPSLFKALAARPGGPPYVRITGIGFPHYSIMPARTEMVLEGVQKTGRQLSDYAALCGVPFEYTAWAGTRDTLQMQDFVNPERDDDEVLVVISAYMLRYVMDDTLDSPSARSKLLRQGRSINPNVYIQGIVSGSYSTPFFTRRFREALFHFESLFDVLDTFIERENTDRIVFESEILGKAILNIVACEGTEVVERVDKYKQWQSVTEEVGFEQLPLNEDIKNNVQVMLKTWHKEYTVAEDSQYLLMGWKGRMLHGMSTWKATA